jgi:riboflavin synthase
MFTGIVSALGTVRAITPLAAGNDMHLVIGSPWPDTGSIALGASIACSGCCLTAVEVGADYFAVQASAETLSCTTLGGWRVGSRVNLERALRMGDELGGHIVSGHVDGVGEILWVRPEAGSLRFSFRLPGGLARYIASKGSVAIEGVSLTVNEVDGDIFGVNIIPHTAEVTTFSSMSAGDRVNIEIDMLARYVARLREYAPL